MAQVSLSIAKSSRSPASPSAQPEIPLCSLCLCALCVKHNLPAAHVDATQGVPGKFSLNTEDTEALRTQRRDLSNLEDNVHCLCPPPLSPNRGWFGRPHRAES